MEVKLLHANELRNFYLVEKFCLFVVLLHPQISLFHKLLYISCHRRCVLWEQLFCHFCSFVTTHNYVQSHWCFQITYQKDGHKECQVWGMDVWTWMSGHEIRIAKLPNCGISICWKKSHIETDQSNVMYMVLEIYSSNEMDLLCTLTTLLDPSCVQVQGTKIAACH